MHLIRLRAGWVDPNASPPGRVTLPIPPGCPVPGDLERSFQVPAVGAGERIALEFRDMPGLIRAELGGVVVVEGPVAEPGGRVVRLPDDLPRRVVLRLRIDGEGGGGGGVGEDRPPWGSIAIRIEPASDQDDAVVSSGL
jgi:hypothetical protein